MDDITKNMAGRLNAFTDRILEALKMLGVDTESLPVRTWTSIQFVPANEEEEIDEEDNKFLLPDLVLREGKNPVQECTSDKLWPGILSYAYTTTTALDMEQNPRPSDTRAYLTDDELAEATADADDGEKYSDEEEDEGNEADADVPGLLDLGVNRHEAGVHVALVAEGGAPAAGDVAAEPDWRVGEFVWDEENKMGTNGKCARTLR